MGMGTGKVKGAVAILVDSQMQLDEVQMQPLPNHGTCSQIT